LKIIHIKAIGNDPAEPKIVKMGYSNVLSEAGFIGLNLRMFLVDDV
jgi:hypothetical protein